ncbi:hypothetical protein BDR03DRAFT_982857 [Suillus americanus]|nr:hypothetical protein BDR03DRAFT_982857 [Suillus americanus]
MSQAAWISIGGRRSQVLCNKDCAKWAMVASSERRVQHHKMNLHQWEHFLQAEIDVTTAKPSSDLPYDLTNNSFNHDFDVSTIIPPVGKEGFSVNHGGGELELYEDLSNTLSSQCTILGSPFCYKSPSFVSLPTTISNSDETSEIFSIEVVDLYKHYHAVFAHSLPHLNVMAQGCIEALPIQPTVAITL